MNPGSSPIDSLVLTHATCDDPNGSATLYVDNDSLEYLISWTTAMQWGPEAFGLTPGEHEVNVSGSGCNETVAFTIEPMEELILNWATVEHISCFGLMDGSLQIEVVSGNPPYTFFWPHDGTEEDAAQNLAAGTYTVWVLDAEECDASLQMHILSPEPIGITGDIEADYCENGTGQILVEADGDHPPFEFNWLESNDVGPLASDLLSGNYTVEVTDANGCVQTATFNVPSEGDLEVSITPSLAEIYPGDSVHYEVFVSPNQNNLTYDWSPPQGLSCTDCPNPVATPIESVTYSVTVMSEDGCRGSDMASVSVMTCPDMFLPNIFSPNGDGLNDELCVLGECVSEMVLSVYNRWGELIFESSNPRRCWDGTFRGLPVSSGTLAYTVWVKRTNGEVWQDYGTLTIQR